MVGGGMLDLMPGRETSFPTVVMSIPDVESMRLSTAVFPHVTLPTAGYVCKMATVTLRKHYYCHLYASGIGSRLTSAYRWQ
jgi:hypothetical protein